MSKNDIWYGFLQAGAHSSPVVRDMTLETSNRNTIYLYNHARGKFLEYSREIVESKLRELDPGDVTLRELEKAFKAARKSFPAGRSTRKWSDDIQPIIPADAGEPELPPELDATEDFMEEDA